MLWARLVDRYRTELLAFLKLFKGDKVLGFSFEDKNDKWMLSIHLSRGVIQISGNKRRKLKDTVYVSPIIETIH
jgi:hypothetical protein